MDKFWLLVLSLLAMWPRIELSSRFAPITLTKILCESNDPQTIRFNQCLLQKNKNNIMSLYVNMSHTKSTALLVNLNVLRQSNNKKFTPFLFQTMLNFCEFVRNPNAKQFWGSLYEMILPFSNINHTCPYDHDFIIAGFTIEDVDNKFVPVPRGNYLVEMKLSYGDSSKGKISLYCSKL